MNLFKIIGMTLIVTQSAVGMQTLVGKVPKKPTLHERYKETSCDPAVALTQVIHAYHQLPSNDTDENKRRRLVFPCTSLAICWQSMHNTGPKKSESQIKELVERHTFLQKYLQSPETQKMDNLDKKQ